MRMTHTLAANCHINNPARFPRRSSRSHLRNLLSAQTFCHCVEQQKETLSHLLTWPAVNVLSLISVPHVFKKQKKASLGGGGTNSTLNGFSLSPCRVVCTQLKRNTFRSLGFTPKCRGNVLCISLTKLTEVTFQELLSSVWEEWQNKQIQ